MRKNMKDVEMIKCCSTIKLDDSNMTDALHTCLKCVWKSWVASGWWWLICFNPVYYIK